MKRITVFCGSSTGNNPSFGLQAQLLGKNLANRNIELVYGGAKVGLMGILAQSVLAHGGKAIGVIPKLLKAKELVLEGLTDLIVVENMHQRKAKMNDLCDGVIALPGGFGTLDELFEMLTWAQLGLHQKPIGLLNIDGFYDSLVALLQTMVAMDILKEQNKQMLLISNNIDELLEKMEAYIPIATPKWIESGK